MKSYEANKNKNVMISDFKRSMCKTFCGHFREPNCSPECQVNKLSLGNWNKYTLRDLLKRSRPEPEKGSNYGIQKRKNKRHR